MNKVEEIVDLEVNLGKELASKLHAMTKKELLSQLGVSVLRNRVQDETVNSLESEKDALQSKLDKAESYVEQGRAMIESILEKWYDYN